MHSSRMCNAHGSSCPWGTGGGGVGLPQCMLVYTPWVWAWRTPLGVDLETPQVWAWGPHWVRAWRPPLPDPSTSSLDVGLETP